MALIVGIVDPILDSVEHQTKLQPNYAGVMIKESSNRLGMATAANALACLRWRQSKDD
jgi:hypothetical protein